MDARVELVADFVNSDGESVPVLHMQGYSKFEFGVVFSLMRHKPCSIPGHVGVVTCCNKPVIEQSDLIKQLKRNGIAYVNPGEELFIWRNSYKPQLIIDGINALPGHCTHVLTLDSLDVMLNGDFAKAVAGYESYRKPVLFGASRNNHPNHIIDKVERRDWRGNFRYLNAGTSFGPRAAMKRFYELVAGVDIADNDQEQIMVRHVFADNQDWVEFDWRCLMFQTFSGANVDYREDGSIKVY